MYNFQGEHMLTLQKTTAVVASANKEALKVSAEIVAGNILNAQVVKLVKPRLPMMVKGYADTEIGEAVIANLIAAALIHTMPHNKKATAAASCMIQAASIKAVSSFNFEAMVEDLLAGVSIPGFDETAE